MSIKTSLGIGIDGIKSQVEQWLQYIHLYGAHSLIRIEEYPFWMIDIDGYDVNLMGYQVDSLPEYIRFNEIRGGNFICSYSKLTSMKGFPKMVGRVFDISYSKISSLEDCPLLVDVDFVCCGMPFTKEQIEEKVRVTRNIYC